MGRFGCIFGALLVVAGDERPAAERQIASIQGQWIASDVWSGGHQLRQREVQKSQVGFEFHGERFTLTERNQEIEAGPFTIDGDAAPFVLTVGITVNRGKACPGRTPEKYLFELDGDKMTIAWIDLDGLTGRELPKKIDTKSDVQRVYVMTRIAK